MSAYSEHEMRLRDECALIAFKALMESYPGLPDLAIARVRSLLVEQVWALADEVVLQRNGGSDAEHFETAAEADARGGGEPAGGQGHGGSTESRQGVRRG